jgi:hypothetical protein
MTPIGPLGTAAPDGGGVDDAQAERQMRAPARRVNVHVATAISFIFAYRDGA